MENIGRGAGIEVEKSRFKPAPKWHLPKFANRGSNTRWHQVSQMFKHFKKGKLAKKVEKYHWLLLNAL